MSKDNGLSPKSRRTFQRVISGLKKDNRNIRFLTLTSSVDAPADIQKSWHRMKARLDRRYKELEYIRVQEYTQAGRKHLHVLIRGPYLEQAMISAWWSDIHNSPIVDIRKVRFFRSTRAIASYMAKYMSKEGAGRLSWSWGWVWRGFARDWTVYKRWWRLFLEREGVTTFSNLLYGWDCILTGKLVADFRFMLMQCKHEVPFDTGEFFPLQLAAIGHTTSRSCSSTPA